MRWQRLNLYGVAAVLAFNLMMVSRMFEAAQTAPGAASSSAAGKPSGSSAPMAVLQGKIKFQGTAPAPQPINMSADPACVPFMNMTEDVQVSNQGLENVMVYVSSPLMEFAPSERFVLLDQRNCRYDPHVLTLQVGETLVVRNSDNTLHNVHAFMQVNSPFNIGQPIQMTSTHIFDKAEVPIRIGDDVHKWKVAFVGVFSHPYHTVSKTGGLYELRLPAGTYEITAWHEKYGKSVQSVTMKSGENPALDFVYTAP